VVERNEVRMLGKAIYHCQDDTFAMNTRETFNEIHRDIRPDLLWNLQWLQQSCRVECLCLVTLADDTGAHKVLHQTTVMVDDEVLSQPLQCLLNALMPC
jgi:hypothetical protein